MSSKIYALLHQITQPLPRPKWVRICTQKMLYRFAKLPFSAANVEAISGTEKGVSCALCSEGRPLGENNALPEYFRPVNQEMRVTSLKGSRHGCPINTAALGSVIRNWKDSLDVVRILRDEYIKRINTSPPLNYIDLAALSQVGTAVPAFMLRRANSPLINGELPAQIAGVYKIVAGLNKLANSMIAHAEPLDQTLSTQQLFEHAEKHDIFISPGRVEACGGPEKLILELLDVVIDEPSGVVAELPGQLQCYIPDIDELADYTVDFVKLHFANRFYMLETEKAVTRARSFCREGNRHDTQIYDQLTSALHTPHTFRIDAIHKTLEFSLEHLGIGNLALKLDRAEKPVCNALINPKASTELQNGITAMLGHMLKILHHAIAYTNQQQQLLNRHLGQSHRDLPVDTIAANVGIEAVLKAFGFNIYATGNSHFEFGK